MMPVIRISDPALAGLRDLTTWLKTKTPGDTVERLVRDAMEQHGFERDEEPEEAIVTNDAETMEFKEAPGLAFTKPLSAKINGKSIRSPRWSSILLTMIAAVKEQGLDGKKLVRALNIPAKVGQHEDEGFKHHAELDISVQGQSANDAWREVARLANEFSIPVKVEFWWRRNSKAQYPGRTGIIKAGG